MELAKFFIINQSAKCHIRVVEGVLPPMVVYLSPLKTYSFLFT